MMHDQTPIRWPAPAKLNLFLHVNGRRPDGYHELQTLFIFLNHGDWLEFEPIPGSDQLTLSPAIPGVPDEQNLIIRAARLLQSRLASPQGAHIRLEKVLPMGGGIGGGSSDAASTLLALNRLWKLQLPRSQLQAIGLTLGADVPFFLCGGNAWVEGIGDIIAPLELEHALPGARFAVVKPAAGLETKAIFSHPLLKRDCASATIQGFAAAHYQFGSNALQPVAQTLCPEIGQAIDWLASKGLQGRMTGSGSAVFAPIAQSVDLQDAPQTWQVKMCNNLRLHPLTEWASDGEIKG